VVVVVDEPSAFSVVSVTVPSVLLSVVFFGKPVGAGSTTVVVVPLLLTVVVVTEPSDCVTFVVDEPSALSTVSVVVPVTLSVTVVFFGKPVGAGSLTIVVLPAFDVVVVLLPSLSVVVVVV
jgi:hypothetical protein